jgi:hypothetical protein
MMTVKKKLFLILLLMIISIMCKKIEYVLIKVINFLKKNNLLFGGGSPFYSYSDGNKVEGHNIYIKGLYPHECVRQFLD